MRIPAMARVTKLSEEKLTALSESNPVFAPGVGNYVAMGGVRALWKGDLAAALRDALENTPVEDTRAQDGARRGGRKLILAPDSMPMPPLAPQIDSTLVKAIARAFRWQKMLETGPH